MLGRVRNLLLLLVVAFAALAGAQNVVVMQSADAKTLDPTQNRETPTFNVMLHLFDALVFKNPDGTFAPGLAESWSALDDLTWEFHLRDGVKFHDGEPLTADAVKFTVERIKDPEAASPIAGGYAFIDHVEVVDPLTVRIVTKAPTPLAEVYFSEIFIVPPAYYQRVGAAEFATHPVGTGPFKFVGWTRDVSLTLAPNADYWRGAPSLPGIVFQPVPEAITRFSSLSAGEADVITQVPPSLTAAVDGATNAHLATVDGARVLYIGINTTGENAALKDPRVRQALNYAVDRNGIVQGILGGLATATTGLLTPIDFGYDPELAPYPYDPERARALLAEAGYASGLTLVLGTPNGRYVNDVQVAQAVAAQLQAVGVTVDLQVREYGAYVGELFSGAAPDLFLIGWGNAPFDADFVYWNLLRTDQLLSYYSNPELDALIDVGHTTIDRGERLAAYLSAAVIIQDEAPMIFLYKQKDAYGVSDRLVWEPRADEFIYLYGATLK